MRRLIFLTLLYLLLLTTRETTGAKKKPPPPPPPVPLIPGLLNFLDLRLAIVYPIIQRFKAIITSDPLNVTGTWVGPDICNYKGFICDNPPDNESAVAVAGIDFNGFRLEAPTLVGFIDQLPDLGIFHANTNAFTGVLPLTLANLTYLFELDLSNNLFTGPFPLAALRATGLTFLDLRFNLFTGVVPPQVFTPNLEALFLNNNLFLLTLPANLGATPVEYLTFANNKLGGPIPSSIGDLNATLVEVLFLNNFLSGCVPYEIGFLAEAKVFDASINLLTGTLPSSLACLQSVEILSFSRNRLSGAVPEVACSNLGRRKNFYKFSLSDNYLTSVGKQCMNLYKRGVLDLRRNCIPNLPDQRSPLECTLFAPPASKCLNRVNVPCMVSASNADEFPPRRGARAVEPRRRLPVTYGALLRARRV